MSYSSKLAYFFIALLFSSNAFSTDCRWLGFGAISTYDDSWIYPYLQDSCQMVGGTLTKREPEHIWSICLVPHSAHADLDSGKGYGTTSLSKWDSLFLCRQGELPTLPSISPKTMGTPTCGGVGNPCDPSTGNKYQKEIDIVSNGSGLNLIRHYNSGLSATNNGLGFGWVHQGIPKLEIINTEITVHQSDGRGEVFSFTDGIWQGDADSHLKLVQGSDGYVLQQDQGSYEKYNLTGHLVNQTDRFGKQTLYAYNSNNLVETVTSPFGHVISFAYNASNLLETVTTSNSEIYRYEYDSIRNLTKVIYPDNQFRLYHYENTTYFHALTGITDENGDRYATFAYATDGKAILTQHAETDNGDAQEKFTLSYNTGTQTTVTDAIGTVEILTFEENLGVKNLLSRINQTDNKGLVRSYDAQNNITSNTDAEGVTTTYSYNTNNQRISTTEAAGTPEQRITEIKYLSPDLDLPMQITKQSVATDQLFQTEIRYNTNQTVKDITLKGYQPDDTTINRITKYKYNSFGQVIEIDGPLNTVDDITTLSYYECTTGEKCGQLANITNALGHTTHYNSYDANGRVKQTTSALGLITNYKYDERGRLLEMTQTPPIDQGTPRKTLYSYDNVGQIATVTTPDNITLTYQYDAAHDLRSINDNLGNKIEYAYDLKGNRTDNNIKDPDGIVVKTHKTSYDQRNRVKTLNSGGYITQLIHDAVGNLISETDPNLNPPTTQQYDALHRLQKTIDALGNKTDYQYNTHDQQTQVQAPNDIVTQYSYDDFKQLNKETSIDRGTTLYTYDVAGNLASKTDGNNITSTYQYDALNRLTIVDFPGTEYDISYHYDTCTHGTGRLCSVEDSQSDIQYQYDIWGNRTQIQQQSGSKPYTTQYTFDAGDNLVEMIYPSGLKVKYQRDVISRVIDITSTWGSTDQNIASLINYYPYGPLESITFGNGLKEQRSYDLAYRLSHLVTAGLQDRSYDYDFAGNILSIDQNDGATTLAETDPEAGIEEASTADIAEEDILALVDPSLASLANSSYLYEYDELHRLTDETASYGQRNYSYDENSNRLTRNKIDQLYDLDTLPTTTVNRDQNYIYTPDSQHLAQINTDKDGVIKTVEINYDPAGNTLSKNNKAFSYDARNRIKSFSKQGIVIVEYHYNAQGERIEKIKHKDDGTIRTIHFHYDQQGQVLGLTRYNNTGLLKAHKEFIWLNNTPVAQITTRYKNDGTEKSRTLIYLHTDHLNTPRIATNTDKITVWNWDSDAFGQGKAEVDPDQDGEKTFVPLRFPGQIASEGGVYYNYYRYYDPSTGRYITSDPIGLDGGLNTYGYVEGNPLGFVDPFGLSPTITLPARSGWAIGVAINTATRYAFGVSVSSYIGIGIYDLTHPDAYQSNPYDPTDSNWKPWGPFDNPDYDETSDDTDIPPSIDECIDGCWRILEEPEQYPGQNTAKYERCLDNCKRGKACE